MTFADVPALEAFLTAQVAGMTCSEIGINGSISMDCGSQPSTLNFTGANIDKIISISVQLRINNCHSVQSIIGLQRLETVKEIQVRFNNGLQSIDGFPNLREVDDSFTIFGNNNLMTIGDFAALESVGAVLGASGNEIISIGQFPELVNVGSNLSFQGNKISSVGDFPKLESTGRLIFENTLLTNLPDFTQLQNINFNFEITNNSLLTSLGDFSELCESGSLEVKDNQSLTSLGNFPQLGEIDSYRFEIDNNNSLTSIGDFSSLKYIYTFSITNNDALVDIGNFNNLRFNDGALNIRNNLALTSIDKFQKLSTLDSYLDISNNASLQSISLPSLSSIGNSLIIINNASLNSILDIPNLCFIDYDLRIKDNPLLNGCCDFKPIIAIGAVGGDIEIMNNGNNCSETDILNCTNVFPPVSCKSDFTVTLDACDNGIIDISDLIEGPTCGYMPTRNGSPFSFSNSYQRLNSFYIGTNNNIVVDNDVVSPCIIVVTVKTLCEADLVVSGSIPSNLYEASQTITSDGTVNNSPVDFSAGTSVNLDPNFEVIIGNAFHAFIEGCVN